MRSKKKDKSKSLGLAFYFAVLVIVIIVISLVFKGVEAAKNSKFDGKHTFTLAVVNTNSADLISVSPSEGTETRLHIKGVKSLAQVREFSLPFDAYVESNQNLSTQTNSYFLKLLLNKRKIKTDLTILDIIKLNFYTGGVSNEKDRIEEVSAEDADKISSFSQTLFIDPQISEEKVSIQIVNATSVSGLGNRLARYLTDIGGNVVLVNSSKDQAKESKVLYKEKSYTADKISKKLGVAMEKQNSSSISDITVIIGEDRGDLANF